LALSCIVFSIKTFVIQETEKISLFPNVTDPDSDKLITTYSSPLNEKGEWQTNYGDAGQYKATITVSDGIANDSKDVLIIVKKKEESPKIELSVPQDESLDIKEGSSIEFKVLANDVDKDELSYNWYLDGKKIHVGQEFLYDATYNDAGNHKVAAVISDGTTNVSNQWTVSVENVDVENLIDNIKNINVNANDVARLELPDFEKYGLSYSVSRPIGNKNEWQTTYNDNGTYYVKVDAEGKGFTREKIVKVVVARVDRPPVFEKIKDKIINENEELKIVLNAADPDGDDVTYSADYLPEGAKLNGNVFTWKPAYDTVKREENNLEKNFTIEFFASSRDKKVSQSVVITVVNARRLPVLEDVEPITINEGESLKITPKAYDLDGYDINLTYSGFTNSDTYKSNFGDAGTYFAKVTASNGLLETSKFVQINIKHVNRAPVFGEMRDIRAYEGDDIAVLINASDPDDDQINYSVDNPPEGSSLKGNAFFWKPSYDLLNKKETKRFDLVFAANDGKAETKKIVKAEISDKNRAPKIINATKNIIARANEPVLMYVKAVDEDGDELTYTWDFGFFEKYKATSVHQRIFVSSGTKVVKITVSDGTDSVKQIINVNVI